MPLTPDPLHKILSPSSLDLRNLHILIFVESPPSIQVDRSSIDPLPIPVIDLCANVQDQNSNDGAINREEMFCRRLLAQWPYRKIKFGDDEDNAP